MIKYQVLKLTKLLMLVKDLKNEKFQLIKN